MKSYYDPKVKRHYLRPDVLNIDLEQGISIDDKEKSLFTFEYASSFTQSMQS